MPKRRILITDFRGLKGSWDSADAGLDYSPYVLDLDPITQRGIITPLPNDTNGSDAATAMVLVAEIDNNGTPHLVGASATTLYYMNNSLSAMGSGDVWTSVQAGLSSPTSVASDGRLCYFAYGAANPYVVGRLDHGIGSGSAPTVPDAYLAEVQNTVILPATTAIADVVLAIDEDQETFFRGRTYVWYASLEYNYIEETLPKPIAALGVNENAGAPFGLKQVSFDITLNTPIPDRVTAVHVYRGYKLGTPDIADSDIVVPEEIPNIIAGGNFPDLTAWTVGTGSPAAVDNTVVNFFRSQTALELEAASITPPGGSATISQTVSDSTLNGIVYFEVEFEWGYTVDSAFDDADVQARLIVTLTNSQTSPTSETHGVVVKGPTSDGTAPNDSAYKWEQNASGELAFFTPYDVSAGQSRYVGRERIIITDPAPLPGKDFTIAFENGTVGVDGANEVLIYVTGVTVKRVSTAGVGFTPLADFLTASDYPPEEVSSDLRHIERIEIDQADWDDGILSDWIDKGGEGLQTYYERTGLPATLPDMDIHYEVNTISDGYHFVAGITGTGELGIQKTMMLRSKAYRYSTFDWTTDYVLLPATPLRIEPFLGRLFCFTKGAVYVVNPETLALEDIWYGTGAYSYGAVCQAEGGLFFADERDAYLYDGARLQNVGSDIVTNTVDANEGYRSWTHSSGIVAFWEPKLRSFGLMGVNGSGDNRIAYYHPEQQVWTLSEPAAGAIRPWSYTTSYGTSLIQIGTQVTIPLGNTTTRAGVVYVSPVIVLNNEEFVPYYIEVVGDIGLTGLTGTYQMDEDGAWNAISFGFDADHPRIWKGVINTDTTPPWDRVRGIQVRLESTDSATRIDRISFVVRPINTHDPD